MDIQHLNENFGLAGVLAFHATTSGLIYASVATAQATATVYLQGAHVAGWQPKGQQPVIFVSRKSEFAPGKPIRGGVPIAFPWFANRHDGKAGPSHGFARIQEWALAFAALAGDDLHLTFTLGPTEISRALGYDHFRLVYELTIGHTLTMKLTVANDAAAPLVFEEALHTYYAVADIHEVAVDGLSGVTYLDKTDNFQPKVQHGAVVVTGPTDRVYSNTSEACVLHDVTGKRNITVAKTGSNTTVVWNPWESGASKLPDLEATEWHEFIAVETVNAAANAVTLASDSTHVMQARVSIEDTKR
ncbi:MAG: D-hexose-6-phosphate mutarotase [Edaphobacter sp.]